MGWGRVGGGGCGNQGAEQDGYDAVVYRGRCSGGLHHQVTCTCCQHLPARTHGCLACCRSVHKPCTSPLCCCFQYGVRVTLLLWHPVTAPVGCGHPCELCSNPCFAAAAAAAAAAVAFIPITSPGCCLAPPTLPIGTPFCPAPWAPLPFHEADPMPQPPHSDHWPPPLTPRLSPGGVHGGCRPLPA
jgi:hypothetical protein